MKIIKVLIALLVLGGVATAKTVNVAIVEIPEKMYALGIATDILWTPSIKCTGLNIQINSIKMWQSGILVKNEFSVLLPTETLQKDCRPFKDGWGISYGFSVGYAPINTKEHLLTVTLGIDIEYLFLFLNDPDNASAAGFVSYPVEVDYTYFFGIKKVQGICIGLAFRPGLYIDGKNSLKSDSTDSDFEDILKFGFSTKIKCSYVLRPEKV